MKLTLVLHNIRSTYNVGAILRTAEGFGVEKVILSGVTPRYDDPNALPHLREKLNHQIAKSALGAEKLVKIELVDDLISWLERQKSDPETIVLGLENNLEEAEQNRQLIAGSKKAEEILASLRANSLILVLGEEVHGIPAEIRGKLDYFLEFPMQGQKESFNVSVATGMALWELKRDSLKG